MVSLDTTPAFDCVYYQDSQVILLGIKVGYAVCQTKFLSKNITMSNLLNQRTLFATRHNNIITLSIAAWLPPIDMFPDARSGRLDIAHVLPAAISKGLQDFCMAILPKNGTLLSEGTAGRLLKKGSV
ncbi:hypothetical protein EDD11_010176 [Mortierella claussenii]|nr:hypothetical protein EDD11_010176 [Mortierella claussenii]